jgi:hypothetical protein
MTPRNGDAPWARGDAEHSMLLLSRRNVPRAARDCETDALVEADWGEAE